MTRENRLLTPSEAAEYLGFSLGTLAKWRCQGGGPPYLKITPRAVRYCPVALKAWAEERKAASTSEYR
jgi:predicted DNA-binding transcriptional regulator AlpA